MSVRTVWSVWFRHTGEMLEHFEKKREVVREEQRWRREHGCVHCKLGRCRYREVCRWRLSSDSEYSSGEEGQGEAGAEQCGVCQEQGDWERARMRKPSPRGEWKPRPREKPVDVVWVGREREGSGDSILLPEMLRKRSPSW